MGSGWLREALPSIDAAAASDVSPAAPEGDDDTSRLKQGVYIWLSPVVTCTGVCILFDPKITD